MLTAGGHDHVTQLIADNWKIYPEGFAVQFYGASTGSEVLVKEEGVNQFRQRGYKSATIIDATGYARGSHEGVGPGRQERVHAARPR